MPDDLTAEEVRSLLNLEPNATCGFVRGTYVSGPSIAAGGLPPPFTDQRPNAMRRRTGSCLAGRCC